MRHRGRAKAEEREEATSPARHGRIGRLSDRQDRIGSARRVATEDVCAATTAIHLNPGQSQAQALRTPCSHPWAIHRLVEAVLVA